MEKQQALDYVKNIAAQRIASKEELERAYDDGSKSSAESNKKFSVANLLFYVGGGIVVLSIAILIGQNWNFFNDTIRILSTFGIGLIIYFLALYLSRDSKLNILSGALYFVSAAIIPIGLEVVFYVAGLNLQSAGIQSIISGILLLFYLSSAAVLKKDIFIFFSIIFGTWFFVAFTDLISSGYFNRSESFFEYRILLIASSYLLLGYNFAKQKKTALKAFLYGFGILGFLGSALALGGWKPSQNIFWEAIFPFLVFGALLASVYLKSREFLVFGSLFLVGYIAKITAEYFSQSLGWPLALLIAGLLLIGASYGFFYLRKNIGK
ncbi:MAG: DUF2157 domain-containing protein [Candidatus Paceibacterota bacterium]